MKKSATVLFFAAGLLFVSSLPVSAYSGDRSYERDRGYSHYYQHTRQPAYYYAPVVTTPYWCGTYYSSRPCPVYQPYYSTYPQYYPYQWLQGYGYQNYYMQPGYYSGGAWMPHHSY